MCKMVSSHDQHLGVGRARLAVLCFKAYMLGLGSFSGAISNGMDLSPYMGASGRLPYFFFIKLAGLAQLSNMQGKLKPEY